MSAAPAIAAPAQLGLSIQLSHGLGSVAFGVKEVGFTTFLLIYFNQVLGYEARLVSLVLVAALLVDAVVDPLLGHLTDSTRSRWGRRLPWLYLAPVPLALVWTLLWIPPAGSAHGIAWLFVVAVAVRALISACEIPSIALVPELTRDYDERTRLIRFRYLFGWLGGMVTTAAAYGWFLKKSPDNPEGMLGVAGYLGFGLFGAALMAGSVLISAMLQHRHVALDNRVSVDGEQQKPGTAAGRMRSEMREIGEALRHPAFIPLAIAGLFAFGSQAINFAIANYMFLYVLRLSEAQIQFYPAVSVVAVVAAVLMIGWLHGRFGKRETAVAAALMALCLWCAPYVLIRSGAWPAAGSTAAAGLFFLLLLMALIANIIVTISQGSMVADVVEAHEAETGERKEGTFYAGNFLINKSASALGIFLTGQIIALAGLGEKTNPASVTDTQQLILALSYIAAMLMTGLAAAIAYRRYPITRESHAARMAGLQPQSEN